MNTRSERIIHIFQYMEWDKITGSQLDLVDSFESQFKKYGKLSDRQFEILEDIFKRAAEK
jgi:hypothetical protein